MTFKKNNAALLIMTIVLLMTTSCGNPGDRQTKPDDSGTTTPPPSAPTTDEQKDCSYRIELPEGCTNCPDNVACEIKISQAHWIPYDTFRKAIQNYFHRPSTFIGKDNVIWALLRSNCSTHRIELYGDHDDTSSNDDITIKPVKWQGAKAFYEISFFNGLLALDAKQIYFYKGDTRRNENMCKDILIEVVYRDSVAYYDLSDSEETK
jgi:hypothetical protein